MFRCYAGLSCSFVVHIRLLYYVAINNKSICCNKLRRQPLTNHKQKSYLLISILIITLFITSQIILSNSRLSVSGSLNPGTTVSGELTGNTTWTLSNSPYIIENTILIPEQVNLTIESGVTIVTQLTNGTLFEINGIIDAKGTADSHITFDGNGVSFIFKTNNLLSGGFMSLTYCNIRNAERAFWFDNTASINITHSDLSDLSQSSHLLFPAQDSYIEYNTFVNSSGIGIGTDDYYSNPYGMVNVRYNLFTLNQGFFISNLASYGLNKINVNNNTFINTNGVILGVEKDYITVDMNASQNYWGTLDTSIVDSMIFDKNDDASCNSYINYLPIIDAPDPETPIAPTPTSTPEPTPSTSPTPSPTPSPTFEPSPTVFPTTSNDPTPSSSPSITPTPSSTPIPTSLSDNSPSPQPTSTSNPLSNTDPSPTPIAPELTVPIVIVFLFSILIGVTVVKMKKNKPISLQTRTLLEEYS